MKAFLTGFLLIFGVAVSFESFALPNVPSGWTQYSSSRCGGGGSSSNEAVAQSKYQEYQSCDNSARLQLCKNDSNKTCGNFQLTNTPPYESGGTWYYGYRKAVYYTLSEPCSDGYSWNQTTYECESEGPSCQTDTIAGGPINGGWGTGVYDVQGCAYTCGTDYSKLDGQTSMYDAQSCSGTGMPYTSPDPDEYPEPKPETCLVRSSTGSCLDMDKQPNSSCPTGTTYGRVNNQDVCVPSGTPTDPLDQGSQGLQDSGGNQQAEGTPDKAGTGGSPTGSGTGNSTGGSSGTTTCTTSPEGVQTCTSTGTTTTETETTGPATFGGHGDPASWWESNYPEGAEGIASKFSADIGNGPFMAMLDPLKSLPSNGSEPTWSMDMQIGSMGSFGAVSLELPSGVWAFVRFAILFTTVMTVRKLIFGG